jgi:hypothetical protein
VKQGFAILLGRPALLVGLLAVLTALAIAPGDLGSADTLRRLQTTRSFWTAEPAVMPGDLSLVGRNGKLYYWYGIGQSLAMLPADIVSRGTIKFISRFREPPWWLVGEYTVVSVITSTLVCVLAVLMCFRLLRRLNFSENQSTAGAATLLFGTTFLHYTQNMQENNLLLLLTLTGFYFQYDWLKTGSTRSLIWGAMALGANLLTRLTTGIDLLAGAFFIGLCLWLGKDDGHAMWNRMVEYGRICLPCYVGFFFLDRLYQYERFGSPLNTYLDIFGRQFAGKYPSTIAPGWPWSTPFVEGFLGPLTTLEKSMFLYDPLIVLTIILVVYLGRRLSTDLKALAIVLAGLLLAYIAFYARFYDWSGNSAWGDRYITTPVEMLALISVPLLMRYRDALKPWVRGFGRAVVIVSVAIQISSLFFWHPLEQRQASHPSMAGHHTFQIGLRFKNIAALVAGTTDKWGLTDHSALLDGSAPVNTPYIFPALAMHRGVTSGWKLTILWVAWCCLLLTVVGLLVFLRIRLRQFKEPAQEQAAA